MQYDAVAAEYAAHRAADPAVVAALCNSGRVTHESHVLEVGCGTGNYIVAVQEAADAHCCGVDPSCEMLAVARARAEAVAFVAGIAEALPVEAGSQDLVFSIDVVHHVGDVESAFVEAFRALRSGGRLCIGTEDEGMLRSRVHARYFPETVDVDLARYPSVETLRAALASAGFVDTREQRLSSPRRVLTADAYRDKAFSSLHLISDDAFRSGVERMERDLERGPIDGETRHVLIWSNVA
jgi:ubiquinone/menaquinone biosynthesis C-methylase UbiE